MTWGHVLTAFMFAALLVSAVNGRIAARIRFRRERRRELKRLAGIDTRPTVRPINSIRRDPSPSPRRKAS